MKLKESSADYFTYSYSVSFPLTADLLIALAIISPAATIETTTINVFISIKFWLNKKIAAMSTIPKTIRSTIECILSTRETYDRIVDTNKNNVIGKSAAEHGSLRDPSRPDFPN